MISDEAYQALLVATTERGITPDEVIAAGLAALDKQDHTRLDHPLTSKEFSTQVLGMTAEDIARADADARSLYPEAFGIDPAQP